MRQKRFLYYLILQALVIVAVILLFKTHQDVKVAATEAGALFVLMPLILMKIESWQSGYTKKLWFVGMLQFWLLFALPILGLRLLNWQTDFKELSLLGIPGPVLHFWSTKSYLLMVLLTAWEAWKNYRGLDKNKKPV